MLPTPHDYQYDTVTKVVYGLMLPTPTPATFVASPTGTGKTLMQAMVLGRVPGGLQIVPSLEIAAGFAKLWGINLDRALLENRGVYTPMRLRNALAAGTFDPRTVKYLQIDEAHHSTDETHQLVDEYLGFLPRVGWSCTFFRGTPKETEKLHAYWGHNLLTAISEKDAVARGFASAPQVKVLPLVDDETIDVHGGEFVAKSVQTKTMSRLADLVEWAGKKFWSASDHLWSRPIVLTLPTTDLVLAAEKHFTHQGMAAVSVVADTGRANEPFIRQSIFREVVAREKLLIQIRVVGEGVDLPLRIMIDASPTLSPLLWRQRIGRIMRPVSKRWCPRCGGTTREFDPAGNNLCPGCVGVDLQQEPPPQYYACNHNFLRHGYTVKGLIPASAYTQAKIVWGENFRPSKRMVARASGLDGLGRFVPCHIPLADGAFWWSFFLGTPDGQTHYACLMNPAGGKPIWAARKFIMDPETGHKTYDDRPDWRPLDTAPELEGCLSIPAPVLTPPMKKWWERSAKGKGLDAEAKVDARTFQILPLLFNLDFKFRDGELLRMKRRTP